MNLFEAKEYFFQTYNTSELYDQILEKEIELLKNLDEFNHMLNIRLMKMPIESIFKHIDNNIELVAVTSKTYDINESNIGEFIVDALFCDTMHLYSIRYYSSYVNGELATNVQLRCSLQ